MDTKTYNVRTRKALFAPRGLDTVPDLGRPIDVPALAQMQLGQGFLLLRGGGGRPGGCDGCGGGGRGRRWRSGGCCCCGGGLLLGLDELIGELDGRLEVRDELLVLGVVGVQGDQALDLLGIGKVERVRGGPWWVDGVAWRGRDVPARPASCTWPGWSGVPRGFASLRVVGVGGGLAVAPNQLWRRRQVVFLWGAWTEERVSQGMCMSSRKGAMA